MPEPLLSCAHETICHCTAIRICGEHAPRDPVNWTAALAGAIVATIITRARSPWAPIIGALLGAFLIERLFPQFRQTPVPKFTEPLFELGAGIAKVDGEVSVREVAMANQWMQRLGLNAQQNARATAAFERGRAETWRYQSACDSLRTFTHEQPDLRLMVLKMLADMAAVDGHPGAHQLLDAIAERMNVTRATWEGFASGDTHAADYAELEVAADASDAEIKASYRSLIARHHPDRLAPGASAAQRRAAGDKTSRLNDAYARLQRARGMH